jgi:hypothetical protein
MAKRTLPEGTGEVKVTGVPISVIKKLNKIARDKRGISRNAYLKSLFFELVAKEPDVL